MADSLIGLDRSSLRIGFSYRCLLSGLTILIVEVDSNSGPESGKNYDIVWGRYFNVVTGKYDRINIVDGQLVEFE